jgi:glycine cleavage system H protein
VLDGQLATREVPVSPDDRRYSSEHEWAKLDAGEVTVGITEFAQEQLGAVVYVELPAVGDRVKQGESMGIVESIKSASDLNSPITGEVTAVNELLIGPAHDAKPQLVNDTPYADGWLVRVRPDSADELNNLMSAAQYDLHVSDRGAEE